MSSNHGCFNILLAKMMSSSYSTEVVPIININVECCPHDFRLVSRMLDPKQEKF